jgi:hypothetical protein
MTAHYPNRYRYRDRDRFTLQFDIDSDTDFDFDEALANTNKSKMINGRRRDWRLPSTKQSKNVHFFELWDHCEIELRPNGALSTGLQKCFTKFKDSTKKQRLTAPQ